MKITKTILKKLVKEVFQEINEPAIAPVDVAGDEAIMQAMGDDIMAFVEGLPDHQKAELLDTFMNILVQQNPELGDLRRG